MKRSLLGFVLLTCTALAPLTGAHAQQSQDNQQSLQTVYPLTEQQSFSGSDTTFTGDVNVRIVFPENDTAHFNAGHVQFSPKARSAWHSHPAGQHLIVTQGIGYTGLRDGTVHVIQAGDAVWCPPDVEHWHGASHDHEMHHFALTGVKDGENVVWMEHVSDEDYQRSVDYVQQHQNTQD